LVSKSTFNGNSANPRVGICKEIDKIYTFRNQSV
jgi:hypothetical protein